MPALRLSRNTSRGLLLATMVAVGAMGCQASRSAADPGGQAAVPAVAAAAAAAVPASLRDPAVQLILRDLRAARERHDVRAITQFRNQLTGQLGAAAIKATDTAYRQVLGDLIAAGTLHDGRARARYRTQLRALCEPTGLTSALESCATDLATYAE